MEEEHLTLHILDEVVGGRPGPGLDVHLNSRCTLRKLIEARVQARLGARSPRTPVEVALRQFQSNGFFVIVDDRQRTDLDEVLHLRPDSRVSFIRLVQLVGG